MKTRQSINDGKVMYRLQHFKDFQNTLVTVNGGTIIAIMAYISSLGTKMHGACWALMGVAALGLSILFHVIIMFGNFLMLGLIYDGKDDTAEKLGRVIFTNMILASLLLTLVGFISLFSFIVINV
jgi:hypothetical protein